MSVNQIFATRDNVSLLVLTCSEGDETYVCLILKRKAEKMCENQELWLIKTRGRKKGTIINLLPFTAHLKAECI